MVMLAATSTVNPIRKQRAEFYLFSRTWRCTVDKYVNYDKFDIFTLGESHGAKHSHRGGGRQRHATHNPDSVARKQLSGDSPRGWRQLPSRHDALRCGI